MIGDDDDDDDNDGDDGDERCQDPFPSQSFAAN